MLTPDYLAGFFDGEGWITVGSAGRKRGNICVGICNRDKTVIDMIQLQFPNCWRRYKPGCGNWNPIHSLQWSGLDCVPILEYILDYLHIKKEAATLGIELAKLQKPKGSKFPRVSMELYKTRQELGTKIHLLVKRGA